MSGGVDPNGGGGLVIPRGLPAVGTAGQVLTVVGGAWAPSDAAGRAIIPVCSYATALLGADTSVGGCSIDPADYAISGATTALTLSLCALVTRSGLTGTITLYDITADAAAATITVTETARTLKTASVTLPGAAHLYELRAKVATSTGDSDYVVLSGAVVRATWS